MSGPLAGLRIVEMAGLGPGPFCAMLLADMGAEVIRVDRPNATSGGRTLSPADVRTLLGLGDGDPAEPPGDVTLRGRRSIAVDLKQPEGAAVVLALVERADGLIEGFRPGVAERLGIGPGVCLERNPGLVYGRVTGWGQDGPYSQMAGHDLNYLALSGALGAMGRPGEPVAPPLNLIADFGGGGMLLAFGLLCALLEAQRSGAGQVIDASMLDGTALLTTSLRGMLGQGAWTEKRGANVLDGGAPFYDTYETSDGHYVAVGAIEPQFYAEFIRLIDLDPATLPDQNDRGQWPAMKQRLRELFLTRTRDEWSEVLEGTDACFTPVLTFTEAHRHPHNVARGTFVEVGGVHQPAPAPRFSRTPGAIPCPPAHPGQHTDEILHEFGFGEEQIALLHKAGTVAAP